MSRWFQATFIGVFCLFIGMIALVIVVAYGRRSGNTGLDMAKIQNLRTIKKEK